MSITEEMLETLHRAVRTNFEEKAAYVARALATMGVAEDEQFLTVDCGLPSDTYNVVVVRDLAAPQRLFQAGKQPFVDTPLASRQPEANQRRY